jgi:hypothetical protein
MNYRDVTNERGFSPRATAVLAALVVAFTASFTRAQTDASPSKPIAEELFSQGREAVREGRYAEGCRKLAESHRLDPAAGTLLNVAVCHELEGKPATAWAEYSELVALARKEQQPERERIATERMRELAAKLSYVTLTMPSAANTQGLIVTLDGIPLGTAVLNTQVPIDPGSHVIEARATGRQTVRRTFEIPTRVGRYMVSVPEPTVALPALGAPPPDKNRTDDSAQKTVRALGVGALVLGVVGASLGTYFALSANADWEERNQRCANGCDKQAVEAWQSATQKAAYADASFAFALVSGAAGVFMLVVPLGDGRARVGASGPLSAVP